MMIAFVQQTAANGAVSKMLRGNTPMVQESGEIQADIVACVQAVYNLVMWAIEFVKAVQAEDMGKIFALVSSISALMTAFSTNCL